MTLLLTILQTITEWDAQVFLFLNNFHHRFADDVMYLASDKWVWVPFYASLLYMIYRSIGFKATLISLLAITMLIVATDQISANLLKDLVQRLRPSNPDNPLSANVHIVNGYRGGRYGFPSSHAANSFGLIMFIMLLFRSHVLALFCLFWALLVCYSRIYLGVHYIGDIIGGMLIGMFSAVIVYYGLRKIMRRYYYKQNRKFRFNPTNVTMPLSIGLITIVFILSVALFRNI